MKRNLDLKKDALQKLIHAHKYKPLTILIKSSSFQIQIKIQIGKGQFVLRIEFYVGQIKSILSMQQQRSHLFVLVCIFLLIIVISIF